MELEGKTLDEQDTEDKKSFIFCLINRVKTCVSWAKDVFL